MAAKPLTTEAIALTEKKMDMTLDDIIKMSKTTTKVKGQRIPNKSRKFLNNSARDKSAKVRQFMNSQSSLRQGILAQRRSSFQSNQFPLATEVARKAVAVPIRPKAFIRNRGFNWNKQRVGAPLVQRKATNGGLAVKKHQQQQHQHQHLPWQQQQKVNMVQKQKPQTLDSLFSNMKEQRLRFQQNNFVQFGGISYRRQQQWGRGRFGN